LSAVFLQLVAARLLDLQLPAHSPSFGGENGYRAAIGIIMSVHILISGLVSGATQLGPFIEWLGYMRQRPRYDRLAHGLARFSVYYFGIGTTTAILFMVVLVVGLWGHFFTTLVRITWWPFFIEAWSFVLMVVLTYVWYYTWERMRPFKVLHMALGGMLVVASAIQVMMIDIVASYMLTPGSPDNPLRIAINPTAYPLDVHRLIANLAYIGFAIGGISAIFFWRSRSPEDRAFYDWSGSFGLLWGMSMTALQPVVGYSYAKEIQLHAYPAWYSMMFGDLSNVFLAQLGLLGIIFILGSVYFWRRMKASGAPNHRRQGVIALLLVVVTIFAVQPSWFARTYADTVTAGLNRPWWDGGILNPIGNFIPFKVGALTAMFLLGLWSVTSYMRAYSRDQIRPASTGRRSQWLLLGLGVSTSAMMMIMGVIREHARQPYLISGELTISQQQITNDQPSKKGGSIP
jgi:cytochrome bd-type quinol oxidase subunit 1